MIHFNTVAEPFVLAAFLQELDELKNCHAILFSIDGSLPLHCLNLRGSRLLSRKRWSAAGRSHFELLDVAGSEEGRKTPHREASIN